MRTADIDRDVGLELDVHQSLDDGLGDELVPVDAPVDDQAGTDDGGVAAAPGQKLGMKRDLEGAGHPEQVDPVRADAEPGRLRHERVTAAVDDLLVPHGLDEGQADSPAWVFAIFHTDSDLVAPPVRTSF